MKKFILVLAGLAFSSVALASPPTYLEFAYITGGENNNRGSSGEKNGWEFTGSWGFNENWYMGGIIGTFDDDGDGDYDYYNVNGGYSHALTPKTNLFAEGGLWLGDKKANNGNKTDPSAIEAKVGVNTMIIDKFSLFGTFSLVGGDLDTPTNDDLTNFIWSLGGAYSFTDNISMNVKLVDGVNGVNGQDEVLRIGGRWTF